MHSSAGPVSLLRPETLKAIGRQPHGNPLTRQAAAVHFRYRRHLRALGEIAKDALAERRVSIVGLPPRGISIRCGRHRKVAF